MTDQFGQSLKKAREDQGMSLKDAEASTKIRAKFLEALEAGDFGKMASAAQVRGFIRTYSDFLGLNADQFFEDLQNAQAPPPKKKIDLKPDAPPKESKPADSISSFNLIGRQLVERREMLGFTLDDIELHTHIQDHYLKALEEGDLAHFPSPVQARGMLSSYSDFLNLDSDAILMTFADGLQKRFNTPQTQPLEADTREEFIPQPKGLFRSLLSADLVFTVMIFASLAVLAFWAYNQIQSTRAGIDPEPTAPGLAGILLPTATASLEPTATPFPTPTQNLEFAAVENPADLEVPSPTPLANPAGVNLYIVVKHRSWMRISVDSEIQFEGRVLPGSTHSFSGNSSIALTTGDGASLQVYLNNQDLGTLGVLGEVVDTVYTNRGELTPTPTISPTPTITPTPEASLTPTQNP